MRRRDLIDISNMVLRTSLQRGKRSSINHQIGSHSTSTKELDDLTRPIRGKKYIDLVTELNRRSGLLVKILGIRPPIQSSTTDQSKSTKEQDDLLRLREDEDRGLSYNVLKQKSLIRRRSRLIRRSTQDQASERHQGKGEGLDSDNPLKDVDLRVSPTGYEGVVELDLSLRNQDLKKVLINLSKPSNIRSKPDINQTANTNVDGRNKDPDASEGKGLKGNSEGTVQSEGPKSDDVKVATSDKVEDNQSKIIREFVEVYLGVLVWCNPKVEIKLTLKDDGLNKLNNTIQFIDKSDQRIKLLKVFEQSAVTTDNGKSQMGEGLTKLVYDDDDDAAVVGTEINRILKLVLSV